MKFTHQGYISGSDARTRPDFKKLIKLRETKNFWVSEHGSKFRKLGFAGMGIGDWPLYRLDVKSITLLQSTN